MLAVTPIDMSLAPLQITITSGRISRFQCGLSVWGQQRQLNSIIPVSVSSFFATETVGNFCLLRVGTDSLKLFCPPRNQTLPVWVQYLITVSLVFRIRRWRVHLPLTIPGSVSCTLCSEMRTILSLGERKGTHFYLLFSNAKNGWLILLSSPPPWYDCNKWCKSILISCFPFQNKSNRPQYWLSDGLFTGKLISWTILTSNDSLFCVLILHTQKIKYWTMVNPVLLTWARAELLGYTHFHR